MKLHELPHGELLSLALSPYWNFCGSPDFDMDATSGPRSLTRAILANKGLTPHRAKSVRNPRVKKRLKFEKAKKKVSSQKAVYNGGISDTGRYDGEKSGISKVIKSVRLA
jgi:U3 small nucleolar RNA-associated protein 3